MWHPLELPYRSLPGFSERLISDHYQLYLQYLGRWDDLHHLFIPEAVEAEDRFALRRLVSEEGMLRNAVRLHELYFENLVPGGAGDPRQIFEESLDEWEREFRMLALASTGWVVYAVDDASGRDFTFTMQDHAQGFVACASPLLVLDVYEHAFTRDFGIDKEDYYDAFMNNVDWNRVAERAETRRLIAER